MTSLHSERCQSCHQLTNGGAVCRQCHKALKEENAELHSAIKVIRDWMPMTDYYDLIQDHPKMSRWFR